MSTWVMEGDEVMAGFLRTYLVNCLKYATVCSWPIGSPPGVMVVTNTSAAAETSVKAHIRMSMGACVVQID